MTSAMRLTMFVAVLLAMLLSVRATVAEDKPDRAVAATQSAAAATGATPYPNQNSEKDWPGKGVIRNLGFMKGERDAFWARRQKDQGAVVFVGDSLTGGWKNLARDFPKL